ncbi:kinase [Sulfurimonas sp.]|uniref:GHMP family kinase ATP-binding protein n=1 Tax=Sulfurimonas sp. TaxID=2022749 RepID=UPI003569BF63
MIVSRTPYRISFFGGGTDYPNYYLKHGGKTLGVAINKYSYLNIRKLPQFFDYKHRIVYSKQENCKSISEIVHPSVREVLKFLDVKEGLSIHHDGDIPARSGMGSSSSFTVGLLNSLYALYNQKKSKDELMYEAIHIEQNLINERVGSQDQVFASHGGFNIINFNKDGKIKVSNLNIATERSELLEDNLMLFFSGLSRTASEIVAEQIEKTEQNTTNLHSMKSLVDDACNILNSECDLKQFGELLNDTWKLKKSLSTKITNSTIEEIYQRAMEAGAIGGKLLGAGGGGFLVFYVEKLFQQEVKDALKDYLHIPFKFEYEGSKIIINEPNYAG